MSKIRYLIICTVLLYGCAGKQSGPFLDTDKPNIIAVLPFENMTNDLKAGELFRHLFYEQLTDKGYLVQDSEETDNLLSNSGITYAGQLSSLTDDEIHRITGAEALVKGKLIKCSHLTVGFYMKKEVIGLASLIQNGRLLWEKEGEKSEKAFSLDFKKGLKEQLTAKVRDRALKRFLKHPFYEYLNNITKKMVKTFPRWKE
ncbi:GNA1162 family protein [Elusimicrobiota bacterium]